MSKNTYVKTRTGTDSEKTPTNTTTLANSAHVTATMLYNEQKKTTHRLTVLMIIAIIWSVVLLILPLLLFIFAFGAVDKVYETAEKVEDRIKNQTNSIVEDVKGSINDKLDEVKDSVREEVRSAKEETTSGSTSAEQIRQNLLKNS